MALVQNLDGNAVSLKMQFVHEVKFNEAKNHRRNFSLLSLGLLWQALAQTTTPPHRKVPARKHAMKHLEFVCSKIGKAKQTYAVRNSKSAWRSPLTLNSSYAAPARNLTTDYIAYELAQTISDALSVRHNQRAIYLLKWRRGELNPCPRRYPRKHLHVYPTTSSEEPSHAPAHYRLPSVHKIDSRIGVVAPPIRQPAVHVCRRSRRPTTNVAIN